jgi:hypothetical protein
MDYAIAKSEFAMANQICKFYFKTKTQSPNISHAKALSKIFLNRCFSLGEKLPTPFKGR